MKSLYERKSSRIRKVQSSLTEQSYEPVVYLECGSMQITGKVTALLYTQHREGGGLFGRLFHG